LTGYLFPLLEIPRSRGSMSREVKPFLVFRFGNQNKKTQRQHSSLWVSRFFFAGSAHRSGSFAHHLHAHMSYTPPGHRHPPPQPFLPMAGEEPPVDYNNENLTTPATGPFGGNQPKRNQCTNDLDVKMNTVLIFHRFPFRMKHKFRDSKLFKQRPQPFKPTILNNRFFFKVTKNLPIGMCQTNNKSNLRSRTIRVRILDVPVFCLTVHLFRIMNPHLTRKRNGDIQDISSKKLKKKRISATIIQNFGTWLRNWIHNHNSLNRREKLKSWNESFLPVRWGALLQREKGRERPWLSWKHKGTQKRRKRYSTSKQGRFCWRTSFTPSHPRWTDTTNTLPSSPHTSSWWTPTASTCGFTSRFIPQRWTRITCGTIFVRGMGRTMCQHFR